MTTPALSVVISTYNPRVDFLQRTLAGICAQTLAADQWELILIDNASTQFPADLVLPANGRIVREERLGLTWGRIRGLREARGRIIAFVDDDNVLAPDYLAIAKAEFDASDRLGSIGGRNVAWFETPPPDWLSRTGLAILACRDLGEERLEQDWSRPADQGVYPKASPVGAGMVMRRDIVERYAVRVLADSRMQGLERRGNDLSSSGDNSMVITGLEMGYSVVYHPGLRLEHLMSSGRLTVEYQGRLHFGVSRSWVIMLALHGIHPWGPVAPWTVPFRKVKGWFRNRAWRGGEAWIRWRGQCGHFEGRVEADRLRR